MTLADIHIYNHCILNLYHHLPDLDMTQLTLAECLPIVVVLPLGPPLGPEMPLSCFLSFQHFWQPPSSMIQTSLVSILLRSPSVALVLH